MSLGTKTLTDPKTVTCNIAAVTPGHVVIRERKLALSRHSVALRSNSETVSKSAQTRDHRKVSLERLIHYHETDNTRCSAISNATHVPLEKLLGHYVF